MRKEDPKYQAYLRILHKELIPAMGCTEPIAVAYCAAKARQALQTLPQSVLIEASGNIIKNVKSVVVPNTGELHGLEAAAAAGIVAGNPDRELQVISEVTDAQQSGIRDFLQHVPITVRPLETDALLDVIVTVSAGKDTACARITGQHNNIVFVERNGECLYRGNIIVQEEASRDQELLTIEDIVDFANSVDIQDIQPILDLQISYNTAISEEGLRGDYGANIGSTLLKNGEDDIRTSAKAHAAAGSDARMSGCELPVIINSGSGNQGIAASVPVIEYAKRLGTKKETLYRALVVSNLTTLRQKKEIGRLSAYCGAVNAGAGAGAGIAYLQGGDYKTIAHTLVNALAITSGMICDGAKPSCAAKIAVAVDSGILGYQMYCNGQQFCGGDGIVAKGVENTIRNVGRLGKDGMKQTDQEILRIMTSD